MNRVVDWLRSRGHVVLLAEVGLYRLGEGAVPVRAKELVLTANVMRAEEGLEPFSMDLAWPRHRRRFRHKGYVHLLVMGGERCCS